MIDWEVSGSGIGTADEGCSHFIGMMGELITNLPGPFSLRGEAFASLRKNNNLTAISNGASPIALSAAGAPPFGTPFSSDA